MAGDLVILPMDADTLQATFPHWTIFEARNWWFALRSGECLEIYAGPRSLVRHTLRASSAALLAEMLAIQDFLDSLAQPSLTRSTAAPRWCLQDRKLQPVRRLPESDPDQTSQATGTWTKHEALSAAGPTSYTGPSQALS